MQIYTKILIGMLAGAAIGILVGPQSAFLEKDYYKIGDGSQVSLRLDPEGDDLPWPKGIHLNVQVLETRTVQVPDEEGTIHDVPDWVRGRFRFHKRAALKDQDGSLRAMLGSPKTNGWVEAWLKVEHQPVQDQVILTPQSVSRLGDTIITWVRPVGDAFMRLIKMVIVPLVFASLLVGVASLGDIRKLGRLGGRTLGLYLGTTAVAVSIGLVAAHVIQPGSFVDDAARVALQGQFSGAASAKIDRAAETPSAVETVLNIIPTNPLESLTSGNMLQIIFFAVVFGIALTLVKDAKPVIVFFDKIQHAMIHVIHMVMATAPFGVAALVAEVVGTSGLSVLGALVVYSLTVLIGLFIHGFFVYGSIVKWWAKLPLKGFLQAARPAQLIAFSTSSSSAALPVSMECTEERMGVSNSVSSFVLPLGATVNMDGTALYQGVAAIFIAQVFQVELDFTTQLAMILTATMASIGAAGVPGAGMVTLAMVLTTSGIPTIGVALILGMDRILDMFRTTVNVTGDMAVTAAMARAEGESLQLRTHLEGDDRGPIEVMTGDDS